MSAFFVGKRTIDAVCTMIIQTTGPHSLDKLSEIGRTLWMMNALAVCSRYTDETPDDFAADVTAYTFTPAVEHGLPALQKSLRCFLYQCSEGNVPTYALFKRLEHIAEQFAHLEKTEAYDRAPWGLCDETDQLSLAG